MLTMSTFGGALLRVSSARWGQREDGATLRGLWSVDCRVGALSSMFSSSRPEDRSPGGLATRLASRSL